MSKQEGQTDGVGQRRRTGWRKGVKDLKDKKDGEERAEPRNDGRGDGTGSDSSVNMQSVLSWTMEDVVETHQLIT